MAKRLRQTEKEFTDLNDDCIRQILWKLTPTDLCSMSFTCDRIQKLVFDHFRRQYPSKKITITSDSTNIPYIRNTQNYLKYFAKSIQNIRINSASRHVNIQCLFDFVKTECCADLRILELSIAGRLTAGNTDVIKGQLKNVMTVHIVEPRRYDIHHVLLQHCEKLEHLIIMSNRRFDLSWMLHAYPTLNRITLNVTSDDLMQQLDRFAKTFLRLNPQIKHFTCSQNNVIKSVLADAIQIDELSVNFTGWNQLHSLVNAFEESSKRNDIKALKLSIMPNRMTISDCNAIQHLNVIQPIHSLSCFLTGLTNEATFMSQLKFLEELYLHIPQEYGNEVQILTNLSEHLPNLQDLRLNLNGRQWLFKDVTMKFIEKSTKMKFLNFVRCYTDTFTFHANDWLALNERRSSIRCAVPIKIRMDYDDFGNFTKPILIQPATSVVKITFVNMWEVDE